MAWGRVGTAILLVAMTVARTAAEEPFHSFLGRLRDEGYFELAEAYVEQMRDSPLADAAVQRAIELELGRNRLEAAQRQPDVHEAQRQLQQAQGALQSFLAGQPTGALAAEAHRLLGLTFQLRAHLVRKAVLVGTIDQLPPQERDQAMALFQQSRDQYLEAQAALRELLEQATSEGNWDEAARQNRQTWRGEYVHCRFSAALMLFHQAELAAEESGERYQQAATELHDIAGKYRSSYAQGLMAVLYLGRCKLALGDPKLALTYFQEILAVEGSAPVLLDLQQQAMAEAMRCWMDPAVGQLDHAVQTAETWIDRNYSLESTDPEVVGVLLQLAVGYQQKAGAEGLTSREREELLGKAGRLARQVAAVESPWRDQGRELVAQLGLEPSKAGGEFATFADAYQAAMQSHQQAQTAEAAIKIVVQRSPDSDQATGNGTSAIDELEKQVAEYRQLAVDRFRAALALADKQTPDQDLHAARYYLALLQYQMGHYADAAVVADFVLRSAGDAAVARYSGRLALAAYGQLADQVTEPLRPGIYRHLYACTGWIVQRWPDTDDAYQALASEVAVAATEGDLERVEQVLARIPRDTSQWATARLRAGLAGWQALAAAGQQPDGDQDASQPPDAQRDLAQRQQLQQQARQWLTEGLEAWGEEPPTALSVQAAMRLSSLLVDLGETGEALSWLDHERLGPRTLLRSGSPLAAQGAGIAEAIHTVAIRAQMGYLAQAQDPGRIVRETAEMVQKLQAQLAHSPEGRQRLMRVYLSLARDLKAQLAATPAAQRAPLIDGAKLFLEQAGQSARDPQVLAWVGDTLLELDALQASSLDPAAPSPLVERAQEVYRQALSQISAAPAESRGALTAHVQLRLARALSRSGQHAQGLQVVTTALQAMPTAVDLQAVAAEILEAWGDSGNSEAYVQAIRGTSLDSQTGQPLVWGWVRLANAVARHAQFRSLFYQARLHVARCRLQHAKQTDDRQGIEQAKQDVLLTFRLYPLPEDPAQRQQFDQLLKEIQRRLEEQPTGLASLKH